MPNYIVIIFSFILPSLIVYYYTGSGSESIGVGVVTLIIGVLIVLADKDSSKIIKRNIKHTEEIYSIRDDSQIKGRVGFLFGGTINEEEYYFYYIKDKEGHLYRKKEQIIFSRIKETEEETPKIIKYTEEKGSHTGLIKHIDLREPRVIFVVPPNTVTTIFSVQ